MATGFYVEGASLYGNTDKTVGPTLPLGINGGVATGADADTVLTASSLRRQIVTPTADRNYTLPTGALIQQGDTWQFINLSTSSSIVLKASDATTIATITPGKNLQIFAKQDNPTTNTHWVALSGLPLSQVRVSEITGYGATSTKIRRWATVIQNTGTDITYADSANLGGTFTINAAGTYCINYVGTADALSAVGISRNAVSLTTNITGITDSTNLASVTVGAADYLAHCSWEGFCSAGDVIRAHDNGDGVGGNAVLARLTIVRVN